MRRDRQAGAKSAAGCVAEIEAGRAAAQLVESRAGVRNPHALPDFAGGARSIVRHLDDERAVLDLRRDVDAPAFCAWSDTVSHGVFDERLKNQVRDHEIERAGRDRATDVEAAAEADLFDFEIFVEVLHLA